MDILKIICILCTFASGKYLMFINKNSIPPEKRNCGNIIYHKANDCLYLFGGINEIERFNDIWAFYFSDLTWERIEITDSLQPTKRQCSLFFLSVKNEDILYVFGGSDDYGLKYDLWEFNLIEFKWNFKNDYEEVSSRAFSTMTSGMFKGSQTIFIVGGKDLTNQYYNVVSISLPDLKTKIYENSVYTNIQGMIYMYNEVLYRTWGVADPNILDLGIYQFTSSNNKFQHIGQSLVVERPSSLTQTQMFYESNFIFFEGYWGSEEIIKKVMRADMNHPEKYFEEMELIGFEHKAYPGLAVRNNEIFIFGGISGTFTNEIIVAELGASNSTLEYIMTINEFTYPPERVYSSFNQIDNRIFLFGGYNQGDYLNDMWVYYSKNKLWESLEIRGNLPSRRRNHASGSHGDALVIWGGEDKSGLRNDLFIFNILRSSCKEIIPSNQGPSAKKGACGILNFPKFYIFGGKAYSSLSNEVWEYNFNTNFYYKLASSPIAYHNAKCQLLEDKIYILGAVNNENIGFNKIFYYVISENKWKFSYVKDKNFFFAESISVIFPEYFLEYGGTYKNIDANKNIRIYKENDVEFNQKNTGWPQKWSAFATSSAYILSNLIYYSGGLENIKVSLTKERCDNKFNYISLLDLTKDLDLDLYCAPGSFKTKSGVCDYCPQSSYAEGLGNIKCTICPPGTYSKSFGLSSRRQCYPCEEGKFNSKSGMSECIDCPYGKYCQVGSVKPTDFMVSDRSISIQPQSYKESNYSIELYRNFIIICSISLSGLIIILLLIPKVLRNIEKIDMYNASHSNEIGHSLIFKKTKIGGSFTMIFLGAGIFISGLNAIIFFTRNVEEMKTLQPLSVFENEVDDFKSTINVTASFHNYLDACAENGLCKEDVKVTYSNIVKGKIDVKCGKIEQDCVVNFLCSDCEIGTKSQLYFKLTESNSYSSLISVTVLSNSSIPESESSISKAIISNSKQVFIGSVPSEFCYSLTPSVFYSSISAFPSRATGYHISEFSTPTRGSSYTIDNIVTESGLVAVVKLEKSTFGFFTYRYEKQSTFIFFSAVTGSIAGIFQVVGYLMGTLESLLGYFEKRSKKIENLNSLIQNRLMIQINNHDSSNIEKIVYDENLYLCDSQNFRA